MRDAETIDSEWRLVATLRRAARERGGPLPSIAVADALLDERRELTEWANALPRWQFQHLVVQEVGDVDVANGVHRHPVGHAQAGERQLDLGVRPGQ
jgi:hypothetical protein